MKTKLQFSIALFLFFSFAIIYPSHTIAQTNDFNPGYSLEFGLILTNNGPGKLVKNHMGRNGFDESLINEETLEEISYPQIDAIGLAYQVSIYRSISKQSEIGLQFRNLEFGSAYGASSVNGTNVLLEISFDYRAFIALYRYQFNDHLKLYGGPAIAFTSAENISSNVQEDFKKSSLGILAGMNYTFNPVSKIYYSFNFDYLGLLKHEIGPFTASISSEITDELSPRRLCFSHFGAGISIGIRL